MNTKEMARQFAGSHYSVALILVVISALCIVTANIGPITAGLFFGFLLIGVGVFIQKRISLLTSMSSNLDNQTTSGVSVIKISVSELRSAVVILFGIGVTILLNISLWIIFGRGFLATQALKIRDIVLFNYDEYLFFVGASVGFAFLCSRRRYLLGAVLIFLGFAWVIFHKSFSDFLALVGVDSLSELDNFSFSEAKFWISTVGQMFQPNLNYKILVFYVLLSALFVWLFRKFLRGFDVSPKLSSS